MTQTSMPWTGTTPGDAGPYSAANWTRIWRNIIGVGSGAGAAGDSGVLWGSGNAPDAGLSVTQNSPTGQSVIVTAGAALVNGTFYYNDASVVLAVAANGSGNPRIDTVVLRKDFAAQTIRLAVKQGTPAASPVPPGMTQSGSTWEIPLADLTLANGFLTITTTLIAQRFLYANVAAMDTIDNVINASGATVNAGDAMVWATVAGQVTSSANRGAAIAGIVMNRAVNAGYLRLLRRGFAYLRLSNASPAVGSIVIHDANFFSVVPASGASQYNAYAVTREVTGGAGFCLCWVDVTMPKPKAVATTTYQQPGITSASVTKVNVDGTNVKISFTTNTGKVRTRFILPVYFSHGVGTAWIAFNMLLDGATAAQSDSRGLFMYYSGNSTGDPSDGGKTLTIEHIWTGLTPGLHAVTLQWTAILGTAISPVMGITAYNVNGGFIMKMESEELDA